MDSPTQSNQLQTVAEVRNTCRMHTLFITVFNFSQMCVCIIHTYALEKMMQTSWQQEDNFLSLAGCMEKHVIPIQKNNTKREGNSVRVLCMNTVSSFLYWHICKVYAVKIRGCTWTSGGRFIQVLIDFLHTPRQKPSVYFQCIYFP